jgi:hypothetical protein
LAAAKLAVGLFLGPAAGAVVVGVVVVVVVVAQPPPPSMGKKIRLKMLRLISMTSWLQSL